MNQNEKRSNSSMSSNPADRPDRTVLGVGLILASVFAMALADALVKLTSSSMTLWQIFATRALFAVPIVAGLLFAMGTGFRMKQPGWAFLRGILLVLMWLAYYASLPVLSLSVAAVALYTSPLIIALFSAAFAGEPVSLRQWAAVGLGFFGVVAILKPGSDAFSWMTLLPVLGAACYAAAMVLTRSKCTGESPLALSLALNVSLLGTGVLATAVLAMLQLTPTQQAFYPFVLGVWSSMEFDDWALMALLGAMMAAYSVGVAKAYQVAAPSIVATFDYAYLVSAAIWGFLFFSEVPDLMTVVGMVLITAAGILVAAPKPRVRPASALEPTRK